MKKILTLTIGCMLAGSAFAQTSGIKFGAKAGVNVASMAFTGSDYGSDFESDNKIGSTISFHFTGLVDLPVSSSFSVQPGLSLTGKGMKNTNSESGTEQGIEYSSKSSQTTNVMYLEIPVNAVYKISGIYFGAGPYAAFAIAGKSKFETTVTIAGATTTVKDEADLKFGNKQSDPNSTTGDDYKSNDFGLNFLAGYQLSNGVNIGANYGLGLTNLIPEGTSKNKQSNRVISFSVGFMF